MLQIGVKIRDRLQRVAEITAMHVDNVEEVEKEWKQMFLCGGLRDVFLLSSSRCQDPIDNSIPRS